MFNINMYELRSIEELQCSYHLAVNINCSQKHLQSNKTFIRSCTSVKCKAAGISVKIYGYFKLNHK